MLPNRGGTLLPESFVKIFAPAARKQGVSRPTVNTEETELDELRLYCQLSNHLLFVSYNVYYCM